MVQGLVTSSESRPILGSFLLSAVTDEGTVVKIRHLIVEGSSQWVFGRNLTMHCDLLHIGRNVLQLPSADACSSGSTIPIRNVDLHSYLPLQIFLQEEDVPDPDDFVRALCTTIHVHASDVTRSWPELKAIVDNMQHHVCGHSNFNDIKLH